MSVKIKYADKKSVLYKKGVKEGFELLKINSHEISDVLDYEFYIKDVKLIMDFRTPEGKFLKLAVRKEENEDLGLGFETYLMDKQTRCQNGCIFCFIDQLPEGMRASLYFKDDDSRLSFLFGNYITLTNLSERDADRIIKMHISPVNVSVHTMNEELRVKMMKNKNAGRCLSYLKRFAESGIKLNTQLVLCPGINDGKELEYSLSELSKLYPAVSSIAAVPVGLTKHREGLYPLCEYTKETAKEVIDIIEKFGNDFKEKHGTRLAYASDEFYLKAELPLPEEDYYEDYPQIENGVGLWKSLESEFMSTLSLDKTKEYDFTVSIATGTAAYPLIKKLTEALNERYEKARVNVYEIKNDFFGHSITVAGLITGKDLISQLKGKELGERLLIPEVMLRSERDMFLDNVTVEEAEKILNIKIETVSNDGFDLYDTITN